MILSDEKEMELTTAVDDAYVSTALYCSYHVVLERNGVVVLDRDLVKSSNVDNHSSLPLGNLVGPDINRLVDDEYGESERRRFIGPTHLALWVYFANTYLQRKF